MSVAASVAMCCCVTCAQGRRRGDVHLSLFQALVLCLLTEGTQLCSNTTKNLLKTLATTWTHSALVLSGQITEKLVYARGNKIIPAHHFFFPSVAWFIFSILAVLFVLFSSQLVSNSVTPAPRAENLFRGFCALQWDRYCKVSSDDCAHSLILWNHLEPFCELLQQPLLSADASNAAAWTIRGYKILTL